MYNDIFKCAYAQKLFNAETYIVELYYMQEV